jgi:hypothetical protein
VAIKYRDRIDASVMLPKVDWRKAQNRAERKPARETMSVGR